MKNKLMCLTLLDELEYIPLSAATEELIHRAIGKSLSELGKTGRKAVIHYICSIYGLSENELLTNFDLFEKSIFESLGPAAARILLSLVKKELLRNAVMAGSALTIQDILRHDLSIRDIIAQLNYEDILKFVSNIPTSAHSVCMYETPKFRDRIISTFFQGRGTATSSKCYISVDKSSIDMSEDIECITYNELSEKPSRMVDNILDLISKVSSTDKKSATDSPVIKIAEEDAGWWLKNGYTEQLQILEESLGRNLKGNISLMCAFDISKLSNKEINIVMRNVIRHHNLVIIEDPPGLYGPCEHPFLENILRDKSSLR